MSNVLYESDRCKVKRRIFLLGVYQCYSEKEYPSLLGCRENQLSWNWIWKCVSFVSLMRVFIRDKHTLAVLDKFLAGCHVSNKVNFQNYFAKKLAARVLNNSNLQTVT